MSEITRSTVTAVVLAGGTSRRFGSDKLHADIDGHPLLDRTLAGLPEQWPVVCVGPPRQTSRTVSWTREDPPGGGPLAGIAAGLALVGTELVVLLAGDLPRGGHLAEGLAAALSDASPDVDAFAALDGEDVANPLLAAYRVHRVREVLPTDPSGRPARLLLRELRHRLLRVDPIAALDVDTPEDLERLREQWPF